MKQQIARQGRPQPGFAQRRGLITTLTLAGLALNGCAGFNMLNRLWLQHINPTAFEPAPVDKHRLISLSTDQRSFEYRWLPNSSHILFAKDQTFNIVDVRSGQQVQTLTRFFANNNGELRWSPDGKYMVEIGTTYSQRDIIELRAIAWNLQSGTQIWKSPPLGDINSYIVGALSPEGSYFALYQRETIQVWDVRQNRLLSSWLVQQPESLSYDFSVNAMGWSADSTRLSLSCSNGSFQDWHVATGQLLRNHNFATYPSHTDTTVTDKEFSRQWSPDGKTLLQCMGHGPVWHLIMLNIQTGKLIQQVEAVSISESLMEGFDGFDSFLAWSSDGAHLALQVYDENTHQHSVQIYNAHTGQKLLTCQSVSGTLTSFALSPDGRYLAAGNVVDGLSDSKGGLTSTIQFWDARTGKALFNYQAPRAPTQLSWSSDSRFLAAYNAQNYDVTTGLQDSSKFTNFALQVFRVS